MQVFKACMKIIKHNMPAMFIYIGVFLVFVVMVTAWNPQKEAEDFTASRPRMTIFNDDVGHPLSDGLEEYLFSVSEPVELERNNESIQDALFFRRSVYILTIPKGFGESLAAGDEHLMLSRTTLPDSYQSSYSDLLINRYLSAAARYLAADSERDIKATASMITSDLAKSAEVTVISSDEGNSFNSLIYYFMFLAYALTAVMILGVSSIMLSFQKRDIRLRNLSAPLTITSYNFQLILGNLTFAVSACIILGLVSLFYYSSLGDFSRWLMLMLNSLVFIIAVMCMSFLLSQFIRSRNVQQAVANVVALGTCFISGVFVPQEMLGDSVLAVASFTPTYWYIKAVRLIQQNSNIDAAVNKSYLNSLLIQVAFAAAFLTVAQVVSRQRRQSEKL